MSQATDTPSDDSVLVTQELAREVQAYLFDDADGLGQAIASLMVARRTHAALIRVDDPDPEMVVHLLEELDAAADAVVDVANNIRWLIGAAPDEEEEEEEPAMVGHPSQCGKCTSCTCGKGFCALQDLT